MDAYNGGGSIFLARGTDGNIGSVTSYLLISSIVYTTTVPYSECPSGLQQVSTKILTAYNCGRALDDSAFGLIPDSSTPDISSTEIPSPSNIYFPLSPMDFNLSLLEGHHLAEFAALNGTDLLSLLGEATVG